MAPPVERGQAASGAAFGSLVAGAGNAEAIGLAQQIAAGQRLPGQVLVWGPTGVGKTLLLRSLRQEARRQNRKLRAAYQTAEDFTTEFVEAVCGKGLPSFRNKHRGVGLLLLDDLQFIAGKKKTAEELLHTIDTLTRSGACVVAAADRPLSDLDGLGPELVSRLRGGVGVAIDTPDQETRLGLVARLADAAGVTLPGDVARVLAGGVAGGARELSGVVNRLVVGHRLAGQPIDAANARRIVDELNHQTTPRVDIGAIQGAVCRVYGVDAKTLKSDKRTRSATEPRMLAMWLARKYTRAAWSEIGQQFGRRSHSTVISACQRVDKLIDDPAAKGVAMQDALRRVELELRTA